MRKDKLTFSVLSCLYIHFNLVAYFEVRIVAELRSHDDTFALVTDVYDHLSFADSCNDTFSNVILNYL